MRIAPWLSCCLLLLGLAASPTGAAGNTGTGRPAILVLGDSLSAGYGLETGQGWVSLLQRRLDAQGYGYRLVNASVSGETTGGGLARLPRALERHRPAIVVIALGGNDGLRGLPVSELRGNLQSMIRQSRAAGARVVLAGMRIPTNYGPQYTEKFFAVYAELARTERVALVPFFLEGIALRDDLFQDDGIHPNVEAQPILLANLWPVLEPLLER
jgi:acyl-CoA thioesterase-1